MGAELNSVIEVEAYRESDPSLPEHVVDELTDGAEITEWREHSAETISGVGQLRRVEIMTRNGFSYAGIIGEPLKPESEVPVVATNAWFTSTEGHNERVVRNFVRAGNPTFFLGAEGSSHSLTRWPVKTPITLSRSAASLLAFTNLATEEYGGAGVRQHDTLLIGESRGAMVGMGVVALAGAFDRQVLFADLTAPCFPRGPQVRDVLEITNQVAREPLRAAKFIAKLGIKRLVHYPSTIDIHPTAFFGHFKTARAIFSGEAGTLARATPLDSLIHVTTFNDDRAGMEQAWRKIFVDHPNVRITPLPGGHLTIADYQTLQHLIGRNKAAQQALQVGQPMTSENVFNMGNELAGAQRPLAA